MARKMKPMTVLNVPPIPGSPEAGMRFVILVADDEERERSDPGAFDAPQSADHRDDEQLDRGIDSHDRRRELPEPPRVENASQRGHESADAEGEGAMQSDVL